MSDITVGPFSFANSTELASRAVDPDKDWSWAEDGPPLRDAIEAAYVELRKQAEPTLEALGLAWRSVNLAIVKDIITDVVKQWDDTFGWDPKRMSEDTEDAFYAFLARQAVDVCWKSGK